MNNQDKEFLIRTLENKATTTSDPREFFQAVGLEAELPDRWYSEYLAQIGNNPYYSSQKIVRWAIKMSKKDDEFTTLGSLIYPLLQSVGVDTARRLAVIIVSNRLILDDRKLVDLMKNYNIPFPTKGTKGDVGGLDIALDTSKDVNVGPEIDWRGPNDLELQGFLWPEPEYMDGGFLMRATNRALSVCQVQIPKKQNGTGFLIAPNLLMTNYHVLESPYIAGDKKEENVPNVKLRFNYTSTAQGGESEGIEFKLASENPIVESSPVPELDFVLLRVEDKIKKEESIKPLTYTPDSPADRSLNIIQHPNGGPLMFAFSSNGVTGVYDDGRIQYSSKAAGGSSGSPCFNDQWELVAIHHAERSTWAGVRREGIQFSHIYQQIKNHLN